MNGLVDFLKSGTFRRWAVGIAAMLMTALNHKLNLGLGTPEVAALDGVAATLIAGSNYREAHEGSSDPDILSAAIQAVLGSIGTPTPVVAPVTVLKEHS